MDADFKPKFKFKRLFCGFAVALISVLLIFSLCSCTFYWDEVEDCNLELHLSKLKKDAFVGSYAWDLNENNMEIVIPSSFGKYKITRLGGYFGSGARCSFQIAWDPYQLYPDSEVYGCEWDDFKTNFSDYPNSTVRYLDFTLVLNEYISDDIYSSLDDITVFKLPDDSYVFVFIRLYIICPQSNDKLYSQNGKLYKKADGQLVENIFYADFEALFEGGALKTGNIC